MILNDSTIRAKLKDYLLNLAVKPRAIIDELHVHKGNAIADVVAVYKEPHCYEIKGVTDNIYRLRTQGKFYDLVFKKISLVTTKNHLKNAIATTPRHWGIIIASNIDNNVKLNHYRKALPNPYFNKKMALHTLWRQEMLNVTDLNKIKLPKKTNKQELVSEISNNLTLKEVNTAIANSLFNRVITQNH